MTEKLSSPTRAVTLTHRSCNGLDRLAATFGSDGIAALGADKPWIAYTSIRTAWSRSISIGALKIVQVQELLPEGILLDLDGKKDKLAIQEWVDGYLPLVTQIEDPIQLVLHTLLNPSILDRIRGKSLALDELRADFIVPPFES